MAAFLRFGIPGVPLESLDLSHTPLVSASWHNCVTCGYESVDEMSVGPPDLSG